MTRLDVVIVTWNVRDLVLDAIQSVLDEYDRSGLTGELWVVDNASTDGTPQAIRERFPTLTLIEPGENLGFGAANNVALRAMGFDGGSSAEGYVLLLNPDTVVRPGAFTELLRGMAVCGAGLAGARLLYGDGSFQHSAFAFPDLAQLAIDLFPVPDRLRETALNGRYPRELYQRPQPFPVDFPLGAAFMLHADVIRQVGMFDEQFYLYCEEIDWAMRIKAAGWKAVCIPTAEVVHYGGQSTGQVRPQSVVNLWDARLKLYRKHYPTITNLLARLLIRAGMNRSIRQVARWGRSSNDEEHAHALVDAYRTVIRLTREQTP